MSTVTELDLARGYSKKFVKHTPLQIEIDRIRRDAVSRFLTLPKPDLKQRKQLEKRLNTKMELIRSNKQQYQQMLQTQRNFSMKALIPKGKMVETKAENFLPDLGFLIKTI